MKIIHSKLTSETLRKEIVSLCNRAYEQNMETLFETFVDATHILGYYNDLLVCHALWVTRYLQVGTNPILRTAYIEAVATEANFRNRGFASAIMNYRLPQTPIFDLNAPLSAEWREGELW